MDSGKPADLDRPSRPPRARRRPARLGAVPHEASPRPLRTLNGVRRLIRCSRAARARPLVLKRRRHDSSPPPSHPPASPASRSPPSRSAYRPSSRAQTWPGNLAPPDALGAPYGRGAHLHRNGSEPAGLVLPGFRSSSPRPPCSSCTAPATTPATLGRRPNRVQAFRRVPRATSAATSSSLTTAATATTRASLPKPQRTPMPPAGVGWLDERPDAPTFAPLLYGSLGTGIATELAMREPSAGLILTGRRSC